MSSESVSTSDVGVTSWLVSGLEIEEEQILLSCLGRCITNHEGLEAKIDLAKCQQKLRLQISKFNTQARGHISDQAVDLLAEMNASRSDIKLDTDKNDKDEHVAGITPTRSPSNPECEDIPMPIFLRKSFTTAQTGIVGHSALAQKEYSLCEGQANDSLRKIREDLGHLAWQFKNNVRPAKTTKQVTRSWAGVHLLNRHWQDY